MNFLKDKPSSRVLRDPGGGSSNIFGGSDEASNSGNYSKPKPTYQSSVFDTTPEPVQQRAGSRQGGSTSSNIFGSDSDIKNTATTPKKISNTHQSSIFAEPEETVQNQKKAAPRLSNIPMFNMTGPDDRRRPVRRPITAPTHFPLGSTPVGEYDYPTETNKPGPGERTKLLKVSRRDPITGALLDENGDKEQKTNGEKKEGTNCKENGDQTSAEPHLGAVKKSSGIRTAQPPGGKSSITFG